MFRRKGRGRLALLVFLALSITLITLDFRRGSPIIEKAKVVSASVVAPIQRGVTSVFRPLGDFIGSLGDLGRLRSENERLRESLESARAKNDQADTILDENQELTALLGLKESWAAMDKVTAQVTARAPSNYKWAVVIDKGLADGVRPDMPVIDRRGLVGKVVSAGAHQSTVLLLIDPKGAAGARIEKVRDTGVITGNGGNENLSLEFIAQGTKVTAGNKVVTSGYDGGIFPPAIPIGKVVSVSGDSARLEQIIEVEPFVRFSSLDYVQVLLQVGPPRPAKKDGKKGEEANAAG